MERNVQKNVVSEAVFVPHRLLDYLRSPNNITEPVYLTLYRPRDGGTKFVISSPLTLSEFENEVVGPNVFRNTRQPANYQVMRMMMMMTGWLTNILTDHCSLVWGAPST